jgi:hypothetical protein
MYTDYRSNAMDDLLDAERHFRSQAENALRELRSILTELAQRVAGPQIEDVRRSEPTAPEYWEPERWRKFLASLPLESGSSGWSRDLMTELERLKAENQALTTQLNSLSSSDSLDPSRISPGTGREMPIPDKKPMSFDPVIKPFMANEETRQHTRSLEHLDLLRKLKALKIPPTLPVRFENRFPKPGLNEADWERQVRRKLYSLYLMSSGLDIRLEIDYLISQVEGISSRTGALRRLYDSLVEKELVTGDILEMNAPNTSLAMLQLTQEGRELCQILNWEVNETERQRLNRLHQGEQFVQHTMGILIFAMHARLRGYQVEVMPELTGIETRAVPDVCVSRKSPEPGDELVYVEVELSNKELDPKWRNLAQLQGSVALCARNILSRSRLVGDCKLKNLHGVATDLETLISWKVPDINTETPLWAEEW